ncbi:MAG: GSCFA domain-containing protein [Lentisphaeraceae bacterium]|nr:GSCFA domain-containing protein [Lentisphaeraceae bacterium]
MKFRTEINVTQAFELEPQREILAIGSCFADRIGTYMKDLALTCSVNPFGVVYNPLSLARLLERSITSINDETAEWIEDQGRFLNLNYHGLLSGEKLAECERQRQLIHQQTADLLKNAGTLIITFGTSYGYINKENDQIVCNCHRLSPELFERRLLDLNEMENTWTDLLNNILAFNPKLNIIFTVSPVRHVRDSLIENQLSKAQLSVLVHRLLSKAPQLHYFPSYEIMMDDLRDYRFYDEKLTQPSMQAVTYIKEKFRDFCFSDELHEYEKSFTKLQKRLSHKIINNDDKSYDFKKKTLEKVMAFKKRFPFSTLNSEINND